MNAVAPIAGVVVPAHNEEATIVRLLRALARGPQLDVVVVCNGCTDKTASRAHDAGTGARVVQIAEASKPAALERGDAELRTFPRVYVDADVEISAEDIAALVASLSGPALAAAPRRAVPRDGCSWPVRSYYDVWERLPQVRDGIFGRGVVALSAEGHARVRALPRMMSDDLVMSEAFAPHERRVVNGAVVVVRPPRTVGALVRRRARVVTGNAQADEHNLRGDNARTTVTTLAHLVREDLRLAGPVLVFAAVTVAARVRSRRARSRADYTTWERDESSRL